MLQPPALAVKFLCPLGSGCSEDCLVFSICPGNLRNPISVWPRNSDPRFVNSFLLRAQGALSDGPLPDEFPTSAPPREQERCRAAFRGARGQDLEDDDDFDGKRIGEELARKLASFPDSCTFPRFLSTFVEGRLPTMILEPTLRRTRNNLALALSSLEGRLQSRQKTLEQRRQETRKCECLLGQWRSDLPLLLSEACSETVSEAVGRRVSPIISRAASVLGTSKGGKQSHSDLKETFGADVADFHRRHGKPTKLNAFQAKSFAEKIMKSMADTVFTFLQEETSSWLEAAGHGAHAEGPDMLQAARQRIFHASTNQPLHDAQDELLHRDFYLPEKSNLATLTGRAALAIAVTMAAVAAPGLMAAAVGVVGEAAYVVPALCIGRAFEGCSCELGRGRGHRRRRKVLTQW